MLNLLYHGLQDNTLYLPKERVHVTVNKYIRHFNIEIC